MSVLFNNSKISINTNEETNQIVIKFKSKPSAEIRKKLKFNNWRWNPYEKGWFNRKSDLTLSQIESLKDIYEEKLLAPNKRQSNLSKEDYEYIHLDEFTERFGEWEKAYRLEKLKVSKPIEVDGKIIINGEDISEKIQILINEKNTKELQQIAKEIGRSINGIYKNNDTNENILVGMNTIKEIRRHHTLYENHIKTVAYIPQIIENSIFISEKRQTEKVDSPIIKFQYFVSGIKIKNEDYTVKSVIAIDKDGHRYYDQNLSEIEKGLFLTRLSRETSPVLYKEKALLETSEDLLINYDKRLIDICQCPQAQFLDENFEPTKELIDMVRSGKTIEEIIQEKESKYEFQKNIEKTTQEEVENDRRTSNTRDDEREELQSDTQQESDVRNNRQMDNRGTQSEYINRQGSTEQLSGTKGINDVSNTEKVLSEYSKLHGNPGDWELPLGGEGKREIELESDRLLRSTEGIGQRSEITDEEINPEDYAIVKDSTGQLGFIFDEVTLSRVENKDNQRSNPFFTMTAPEKTEEQEETATVIPPLEEQSTYHFEPNIGEDGIIDYTGVEADKILFVDKKHILKQDLPSYLPPIQIRRDLDYAIPACKVADNEYILRGKDKDNVEKLYKVSLDVYAALTNYHLEYDRALVAINNENKKNHDKARESIEEAAIEEWEKAGYDSLVRKTLRETKEYSYKEYECYPTIKSRPSIPAKFDSTMHEKTAKLSDRIYYNTDRVMFQRDRTRTVFRDHYNHICDTLKLSRNSRDMSIFSNIRECRKDLKQKMLDIKFMKEDYENTWTKGRETAYGDGKLDNELYEKYGVMVKRQNGNVINIKEKNELKEVLSETYTVFGDLSSMAKDFKLKVSHAGETRMHAMKAIGVFSVFQNAIGVSFDKDLGDPKSTTAHEFAHFIDHVRGKEHKTYFASDKEGTLENKIAKTFRNNMNDVKGDYWNRTCECFARAMEQYAKIEFAKKDPELQKTLKEHLENGENDLYNLVIDSVVGGKAYMDYEKYQKKVAPLVKELIEQNKTVVHTNDVGIEQIQDENNIAASVTQGETKNTQEIDLAKEFNEKNKAFFDAIEDYIDNKIPPKFNRFVISETPEILKFNGLNDHNLSISKRIITKVMEGRHELTKLELLGALKQIADPIMIFDSDPNRPNATPNGKVLFSNIFKEDKPIVITLEADDVVGKKEIKINNITSVYEKDILYEKDINIFKEWTEKGLLKYYDDTKKADLRSQRWYNSMVHIKSAKNTILTKSDFVNSLSAKKELIFTESKNKENDLAKEFNEKNKAFFDAIEDYIDKGNIPKNYQFLIPNTPDILQVVGVPNKQIYITTGIITKAKKEHKLSKDEIKNAFKKFADPLFIFDSDMSVSQAKSKSITVITDVMKDNKPIMFGIQLSVERLGEGSLISVHDIRSFYAKENVTALNTWAQKGLLKYYDDKKITERKDIQSALNLTTDKASLILASGPLSDADNIKKKSDFVNSISSKKEPLFEVCTIPEKLCTAQDIKNKNIHEQLQNLNHEYIKKCVFFPPMEQKEEKLHLHLETPKGEKNILECTPKQAAIIIDYSIQKETLKGNSVTLPFADRMSLPFNNAIEKLHPHTSIEERKTEYSRIFKTVEKEISTMRSPNTKVSKTKKKNNYDYGR